MQDYFVIFDRQFQGPFSSNRLAIALKVLSPWPNLRPEITAGFFGEKNKSCRKWVQSIPSLSGEQGGGG